MEAICSSKTMANYYQNTQNNSPEDGIIQYRRNVKEMMSGPLTEFQKRNCNINKRKKKFEMTSETLEGFVGFKFSL